MKTIISPIKAPAYPLPCLHTPKRTAFFDIETTGLSPKASSLYLIGFMYFDRTKKEWTLCQWFADNYQSEAKMLPAFLEHLEQIDYLYHFNGRTFDIPYIQKKCIQHEITPSLHCRKLLEDATGVYSVDLLTRIRSLRHTLLLEKCNQTAVEQWLGVKRDDTFTGKELIALYSEYMQQKLLNPENCNKLEQILLLHNHDDVEMMLTICSILTYDEYLSQNAGKRLLSDENLSALRIERTEEDTLSLMIPLPDAVPKALHLTAFYPQTTVKTDLSNPACGSGKDSAKLSLSNDTAHLSIPLYQGTLKFFLPNYKDYYYLPKEDMAVHKSVAEFVDSSFRKKATKATCYIKKEGTFLPSLCMPQRKKTVSDDTANIEEPASFSLQYGDKLCFHELPENFTKNTEFWKQYLVRQLPAFRR